MNRKQRRALKKKGYDIPQDTVSLDTQTPLITETAVAGLENLLHAVESVKDSIDYEGLGKALLEFAKRVKVVLSEESSLSTI